jgi:hypothetical protein
MLSKQNQKKVNNKRENRLHMQSVDAYIRIS